MDLPEMYSSVKQAMDQAWLGQGKQGKWRYSIPYRRLPETAGRSASPCLRNSLSGQRRRSLPRLM